MRCLQSGDVQALGELFLRHEKSVHALCARMTGDAELADDLVQDTFLRALRYRNGFRREAAVGTWLYRIARNLCHDHLTTEARRARLRETMDRPRHAVTGGTAQDDHLRLLQCALDALPIDKREVLILSRYHDLTHAQIARVCDCSVAAVKVRAHRAMRDLKNEFQRLIREEDEL